MKREEAIEVLHMVEAHGLADEAKRIAIEALQAQTNGDLISKHEVSAWLSNMGYDKLADMVMDEKRFPSAESNMGWIPVSEGLPKEHEWVGTKTFGTTISDEVLVTFDVDGFRFVKPLSLQNGKLSRPDAQTMDVFHKGWEMLAWMPLPKPYKGGNKK